MKGFLGKVFLIISCLYLAEDVRAFAVPTENLMNEAMNSGVPDGFVYTDLYKTARKGDELVLKCQFFGTPIGVYWKKGNDPTKSPNLITRVEGEPSSGSCVADQSCSMDDDYSLIINSIKVADQGTYICRVSNYQGILIHNFTEVAVYDQEAPCNMTSPAAPAIPSDGVDVRRVGDTSLSGVVYIRWGNSGCPEEAELIYKGTVGGAHHSQTGSGANYLCMPDEPIYDEFQTSSQSARAYVYSTEYDTDSNLGDRLEAIDDHTPPCAVCKAPPGRTTKLMIPARNVCPSSEWRLEYAGYLMAARFDNQKSEYVCVDRAVKLEPGTEENANAARIYMVEGRCVRGGGIPCGPYIDGNELTCAVCTI